MNNSGLKFMLKEIDERIAKRRKPVQFVTLNFLKRIRPSIDAGIGISENDSLYLSQLHERFTDAQRRF